MRLRVEIWLRHCGEVMRFELERPVMITALDLETQLATDKEILCADGATASWNAAFTDGMKITPLEAAPKLESDPDDVIHEHNCECGAIVILSAVRDDGRIAGRCASCNRLWSKFPGEAPE